MRKVLFWLSVILVVFLISSAGLSLTRNYETNLGVLELKEGKSEAGVTRLRLLAWLGDQRAQFLLGSTYAYGWGVPKNDKDAIYWFERAALHAENGVDPAAGAELEVAKSYAEGTDGVKADPDESTKWLRLAAKGGSRQAAVLLRERGLTP